MRRWAKVVLWVAVFGACGAAGALVASRTDPFPPGVEDPGARPTEEPGPSPVEPVELKVTFTATTRHRLHVGGTCRSDWRGKLTGLRLAPSGEVRGGSGIAELEPSTSGCDFEQVQVQTRSVDLDVSGRWTEATDQLRLRLRMRETGRDPVGSLDLGGFVATLGSVRPTFTGSVADPLGDEFQVSRPDGNQGSYEASYRFELGCRRGCP
jgi:hypothetical protein